tara:strand:- start:168 stop:3650 length:3483 start_codon:yes stop_codon:yes gene_type:complete
MAKINYDGTNIVGGPFKSYVDEQVKVRQEKLGNSNKTSEEIVWENGKSAFVALASSVNIENSKYQILANSPSFTTFEQQGPTLDGTPLSSQEEAQLITGENTEGEERIKLLDLGGDPQQYFGNFLARNVVLYGGTSYYNPSSDGSLTGPNYRFGITENNNVFDDSAYGFGGTNPDGFKPMPGITSFNLKSKNMGSLRDATITLRANSEEQFKMIDNLYCRIGYTMFLEWGNSLYFDNEGKYQKYDYQSSMIPMFLSGKIIEDGVEVDLTKNPTNFISRIEARREESNGNYDAFFGRVKNFSWQYIAKGGYWEISLSLISWGDIIESLTIDGAFGSNSVPSTVGGNIPQPNTLSSLSSFLSIVAQPEGEMIYKESSNDLGFNSYTTIYNFDNFKRTLVSDLTSARSATYLPSSPTQTISISGNNIAELNYNRLQSSIGKIVSGHAQLANKHYYYVRFGDILDFIRDRLLLYSENKAIIDIDTDTAKNICYYPGINLSADPTKVMVASKLPYDKPSLIELAEEDTKFKDKNKDGKDDIIEPDWGFYVNNDNVFKLPKAELESFGSKFNPDESGIENFPLHGKIMNIYFEYQYLLDTIKSLRDEDTTKIPLYDFINTLLQTVNSCLGGVNKLSIRLEDDRIMKIYDQNSIYGTQVPDNEGATINLYGIKPLTNPSGSRVGTDGSFVTDVNVKTELTNDFSTTVSVGAQAQGQVVGEDATGLSRWNFGLVDRYYRNKVDSLRKDNNEKELTTKERIEEIKNKLKYLWLGYAEGYVEEEEVTTEEKGVFSKIRTKMSNIYYFENFPTDRIPDFVKLQKDWLAELIKYNNELKNEKLLGKGEQTFGTNQIGMIPINIQVTMDGLSGIRIYDKLKVDTRFLPNYYPQTLYWVIKGVSHEVVNNKWNTKLETIAVPKLPDSEDLLSLFPTKTSGSLLDSTENQYAPAQNIFSTPSSLSSFAASVNSALGSTYSDSIKASVVFLAQQEQNLQGFNYNYYGVQTDLKWSGIEPYINGSFNSKEGEAGQGDRTANARWFASFKTEADGIKFVAGKLNSKGWGSIEDDRIPNSQAAAKKYYGSWLFGNPNSPKVQELLEKDTSAGNKKQELWDASLEAIQDSSQYESPPATNQDTSSANIDFSNSSNTFLDSGSFGTGTPIISDEDLENLFL